MVTQWTDTKSLFCFHFEKHEIKIREILTLTMLKYFRMNHGDQRVFSI